VVRQRILANRRRSSFSSGVVVPPAWMTATVAGGQVLVGRVGRVDARRAWTTSGRLRSSGAGLRDSVSSSMTSGA
jgi:hypothetical protein